jgi:hypothetical protein
MATHSTTSTTKGVSLAKGPALVLGVILEAAGLYFLYKQHTFLPWSNFPNGHAPSTGHAFFGIFGVNGWTGMFTAVSGGVLLFGAAQHHLAKLMSLVVGAALGAAFVITLIQGNVLGMAAANFWTKIGWAVCAAILLVNVWMPRRTRTVTTTTESRERTVVEPTGARRTDDDDVAEDDAEQTAVSRREREPVAH